MSSPDDTSPPKPGVEDIVSPSQAIIEAVADREGVDPTEIEPPAYDPLYTVINPEALDSLFRDVTHGTSGQTHPVPHATPHADTPAQTDPDSVGRVELEYEGYAVTVYSDGRIELDDVSGSDESVSVGKE
ncbi:uncharacterized protein Nmag_0007 [Natrialba magadii ATCC 43099]|uniref:Halobacterial output domain-containing protein n=1 Tax=Natrialba magadii (strain ATCC 43099 / DSM 3394 / CCM 3739 / CIP 104546 / IAM 13178 / JCM 8861 / NBRC 102185 / NCIMB 2190 / MS3) TaxID=547559 RepID=D3SVN8_NATMM|nr:HalOD1 output domain-containing protein [Natrialba magadii]ADD03607.1 uncharacterized protein Nmag_0007 [Natrialba magadii ATCC 43099]ELY29058.1 hypothetical protein C500_12135 [Natrialba magadii ATCC 43099]